MLRAHVVENVGSTRVAAYRDFVSGSTEWAIASIIVLESLANRRL